jgi:hypothetical protein
MKKKLYIILAILFILVPLGLLTDYSAWGEWDQEIYKKLIGFIPEGIKNAQGIKPIIPDYGEGSVVMYYLSALIGIGVLFAIFYILAKLNKGKN